MKKGLVSALIISISLLLMVSGALMGCKSQTDTTSETTAAAVETTAASTQAEAQGLELKKLGIKENGEPYMVAWVGGILQHEWAKTHKDGLEKAKQVFGIDYEQVGPNDLALEGQATALENSIAKKVDLILLVSFNEALVPTINKAVESVIPVFLLDIDWPTSNRTCFVGVDLDNAWKKAATIVAEKLNKKGKMIYYELPGNDSSHRMRVAFDSIVKDYPDMQVVTTIDTEADQAKGVTRTVAALQANPDVNAIISFEGTTTAAALAAKEIGKQPGDILISGVDLFGETKDLIKQGWIYGSVYQAQGSENFTAISLWLTLKNNLMGTDSLTQFYLPNEVKVNATYLTKDNLQ
ncbi:MAG: substrate-binding domain-containing protein [Actinomycetota bacterium]|nr:substrate-binding domain-containing protein [Actinomycetota bacterium]